MLRDIRRKGGQHAGRPYEFVLNSPHFPRCHPERRKPFGERFSKSNPTYGRARSGVSAREGELF